MVCILNKIASLPRDASGRQKTGVKKFAEEGKRNLTIGPSRSTTFKRFN